MDKATAFGNCQEWNGFFGDFLDWIYTFGKPVTDCSAKKLHFK